MANECKHIEVWADHKFAEPRCLICDPPEQGRHHIKGVRRGDGMITAGDITAEIANTNAEAIAARLPGWKVGRPVTSNVMAAPLSQNLIGNEFPATESEPPPKGVVATPGMGFWRDKEVVDAAKAEYEAWLEKQESLPVIKGEKRQQVDRYVSPVEKEFDISFT